MLSVGLQRTVCETHVRLGTVMDDWTQLELEVHKLAGGRKGKYNNMAVLICCEKIKLDGVPSELASATVCGRSGCRCG